MPRPCSPLNTELPYHLTARSIHRERFPLPLEIVWDIFENHLFFLHHGFGLRIHSFVLMPNHFHMIARAPNGNLSQAMRYLMRETSMDFIRYTGRINQNYGQRYHRSLINSYHYYLHAYKYVYQNPVRARLCQKVEDYPFSTLQLLLGRSKFAVSLEPDELLFEGGSFHHSLEWLNRGPDSNHLDIVRKGLRKSVFAISAKRDSRRTHELETQLL